MKSVKCALCSSNNYEIISKAKDYHYHLANNSFNMVKCKNCGLVYLNPRPSKEQINSFYPKTEIYYSTNTSPFAKMISNFFTPRRISSATKYKKQGKLLDVGCGVGDFLVNMERKGFEVYGVDLSSEACSIVRERLRKRGKTVEKIFNRELEECYFPDNYFDVITLWHTFEHVYDPQEILKEIYRILRKDAVLLIEVPNINSRSFIIFKKYAAYLEIPRHVYHYSSRTIEKMLNTAAISVFEVDRFPLAFPLSLGHSFSNLLSSYKIRTPLYHLIFMIVWPLLIIITAFSFMVLFSSEVLRVYARKGDVS